MKHFANIAVVSAGLLMGLSSLAFAQMAHGPNIVERSHNAYHVAVCSGPPLPGNARCHAHVVTDARGNIPAQAMATRYSVPQGFSPASLRAAYNILPVTPSPTAAITGPTIAIVDAYGYTNAEADLAVYRKQFGLPPCTSSNGCFTKYNQNGVKGSYPSQNTGWAQETALDLDMASAMCPTCKIILVQANSATYGNLAAAVNTAALKGAYAISNSYGGGESGTTSFEPAYNHVGVAITVSSGDSGYGVEFPASSPHVIAVGGTSLTYTGTGSRGWSETAWSGAGSGCSAVYAKPAWQTDPGCSNRTVADTSAVADPYTGVAVYGPVNSRSSGWQVYGGTSVASPLIAGIFGANYDNSTTGATLYSYLGSASLNDIVSGSNGACSGVNTAYLCTAGAGYDGPTGVGTPWGPTAY